MDRTTYLLALLRLISQHDLYNEIIWTQDLNFYARCNDLFVPASSDCVFITPQNFSLLQDTCALSREHGVALFCCRMRGLRPHRKYYSLLEPQDIPFFDACAATQIRTQYLLPKADPLPPDWHLNIR